MYEAPIELDALIARARHWFPDADPVQLRRAIEQSFSLDRYDDHGLMAFACVCSMLKAGIPVDEVVQIVAMTKINLIGQQHADGNARPEDVAE